MDVPLLSPTANGTVSGVNRVAPAGPIALGPSLPVAPIAVAPTTVDLSPLGRFLSAVSLLQKQLEQQLSPVGPTEQDETQSTFAAVSSSAVALVEVVNLLEAESIRSPDAPSLAARLAQQFIDLSDSTGDDSGDPLSSLANIGLTLPGGIADDNQSLLLDSPALEAAFESDPAGTTALLGQTATAFSTLAGITTEDDPVLPDIFADDAPAATPLRFARSIEPDVLTIPLPSSPISPSQDGFLQELLAESSRPAASPTSVSDAAGTLNPIEAPLAQPAPTILATLPVPSTIETLPQDAPVLPAVSTLPRQPAPAIDTNTREADSELMSASAAAPIATNQPNTAAAQTVRPGEPALPAQRTTSPAPPAQVEITNDQAQDELADTIEERAATAAYGIRLENERAEARRRAQTDADLLDAADNAVSARQRDLGPTPAIIRLPIPDADMVELEPPPSPPVLTNTPQQLARDPAVAAALAAYYLSAGPFAALNAKPELPASKIKPIAQVVPVLKVAPADSSTSTNDGARQFR